jgi:hypothetical protein
MQVPEINHTEMPTKGKLDKRLLIIFGAFIE